MPQVQNHALTGLLSKICIHTVYTHRLMAHIYILLGFENGHLVFSIFKKKQENNGVADISSLFQRHYQTKRLYYKQAVLYVYLESSILARCS